MKDSNAHIMNTSANLLGICFLVFALVQGNGGGERTAVDEFAAVGALIFSGSCGLSFISMRTQHGHRRMRLETYAEYLFLLGLTVLMVIVGLVSFKVLV